MSSNGGVVLIDGHNVDKTKLFNDRWDDNYRHQKD